MTAGDDIDLSSEQIREQVLEQNGTILSGEVQMDYAFKGDYWFSPGLREPSIFDRISEEETREIIDILENNTETLEDRRTDTTPGYAAVIEEDGDLYQAITVVKLSKRNVPEHLRTLQSKSDLISFSGPGFYNLSYMEAESVPGNNYNSAARETLEEIHSASEKRPLEAIGYVPSRLNRKLSKLIS